MSELGALLTQDGIAIAAAIAAIAGLMRGFTGFGSSMLMAPVFAILYGPATAVVIIITMDVIVSAQLVPRAVSEARWRFVLPMGAAAIAAMAVGTVFLLLVPYVLKEALDATQVTCLFARNQAPSCEIAPVAPCDICVLKGKA